MITVRPSYRVAAEAKLAAAAAAQSTVEARLGVASLECKRALAAAAAAQVGHSLSRRRCTS